ncbi:Hypp9533 [Branchiostoma lanceolatum]|uniref:Hypp9533 protein n=2 Tax=Branchiostoma lanceolatum TaxID=7740 RepID=A0A8S4MND2_BRALA|nr:Hypp9533 [Branchiostoma lanceolatum]
MIRMANDRDEDGFEDVLAEARRMNADDREVPVRHPPEDVAVETHPRRNQQTAGAIQRRPNHFVRTFVLLRTIFQVDAPSRPAGRELCTAEVQIHNASTSLDTLRAIRSGLLAGNIRPADRNALQRASIQNTRLYRYRVRPPAGMQGIGEAGFPSAQVLKANSRHDGRVYMFIERQAPGPENTTRQTQARRENVRDDTALQGTAENTTRPTQARRENAMDDTALQGTAENTTRPTLARRENAMDDTALQGTAENTTRPLTSNSPPPTSPDPLLDWSDDDGMGQENENVGTNMPTISRSYIVQSAVVGDWDSSGTANATNGFTVRAHSSGHDDPGTEDGGTYVAINGQRHVIDEDDSRGHQVFIVKKRTGDIVKKAAFDTHTGGGGAGAARRMTTFLDHVEEGRIIVIVVHDTGDTQVDLGQYGATATPPGNGESYAMITQKGATPPWFVEKKSCRGEGPTVAEAFIPTGGQIAEDTTDRGFDVPEGIGGRVARAARLQTLMRLIVGPSEGVPHVWPLPFSEMRAQSCMDVRLLLVMLVNERTIELIRDMLRNIDATAANITNFWPYEEGTQDADEVAQYSGSLRSPVMLILTPRGHARMGISRWFEDAVPRTVVAILDGIADCRLYLDEFQRNRYVFC